MEGTAVVAFNREYGKYLVPSEIVVAYADGDDAVAWPCCSSAPTKCATTWWGTCQCSSSTPPGLLVHDRRVDGKVLEFGHSGLLYHSTPLLYDRTDPLGQERLWDPVTGEAVAGPVEHGKSETTASVHWSLGRLAGRPSRHQNPASPQGRPAATADSTMAATNWVRTAVSRSLTRRNIGPRAKTPCFVLPVQDTMCAWPMADLSKQVGGSGTLTVELQGQTFTLLVKDGPHAVDVQDAAGVRVPSLRSMAFGWYSANHAELGPPLQLGDE